MSARHFLALDDLSASEARALIARAIVLKGEQRAGIRYEPLKNRTLGMIFDKSSTRTRISFEVAMTQFGGNAIFLSSGSMQLGRGEPVEDTARVMSRMVDAIVIRTGGHGMVETFARHSRAPVINGLTDLHHPCQLLADIQTWVERRGEIAGRKAAWLGDGNNVCHSWMQAARLFGFKLHIACPPAYRPDAALLKENAAHLVLGEDPRAAMADADVVVTDTWASMGQEEEKEERMRAFAGYQVDAAMMARARPDALFMHCLPAYRGYEVSAEVLDGPQSVVWDEAENRLHAQKALLELLLR
jgi:ornithine carbamoyltransferase